MHVATYILYKLQLQRSLRTVNLGEALFYQVFFCFPQAVKTTPEVTLHPGFCYFTDLQS